MIGSVASVSRLLRLFCAALMLLLAFPLSSPQGAAAFAQSAEQGGGGGLLRFLFQRRDSRRQDRVAPPVQAPRRATTVRRAQPRAAAPSVPEPPVVDKVEDAQRILVVGDFLAGGLADGLMTAFAENAKVVVLDRSNGSSGLVRDDFYDWPGSIGGLIDEEKPAIVVVMIGSNDRQQIRVDGDRVQPRSDPWNAEYERRVSSFAKAIRDRGLPLVWIGNLPFKSGTMSSDMLAFNDVYRRIVTDLGGEYVDVWDGFVDETGTFVTNGPDMNGQPAQLRSSDGINVTRDGRRKIAFYAEKPLNRLLGTDGAGAVARLPGAFQGPMPDGALQIEIDRTMPIAIDDYSLDGGSELLGASFLPGGDAATPAEKFIREGVAPKPQPGRADDFMVRKAAPTPSTDPEKTTALEP